ncbi:hypothetical protein BH11MYX2_BH11MYX2_34360 [soil metagenome]
MTSTTIVQTSWTTLARARLERVVGVSKAGGLMQEILHEIDLATIATVDDLARFGRALALRPGFLAALGTSIETLALMHRARS